MAFIFLRSEKQQDDDPKRFCPENAPNISPSLSPGTSNVLGDFETSNTCTSEVETFMAPSSPSRFGTSTTNTVGQIDIGIVVRAAHSSVDQLRHISEDMADAQREQYLFSHFRPSSSDILHSHAVTKQGRCWNAHFQLRWLEQFPWLSYSNELRGGLCRYCILFPERPDRGGRQGANPGVLVLSPYQKPYTKALGKDGILICHEKSSMHCHAAQKADLFTQSFIIILWFKGTNSYPHSGCGYRCG